MPGGVAGVYLLIQHLQVNVFSFKLRSDLAGMKRGACQSIQASNDEHIAFPDILQACLQSGISARCAAFLLLINLVAMFQFVDLDIQSKRLMIFFPAFDP